MSTAVPRLIEDALPIVHTDSGPAVLINTVNGIKHSQDITLGEYLAGVESRLAACKTLLDPVLAASPAANGDCLVVRDGTLIPLPIVAITQTDKIASTVPLPGALPLADDKGTIKAWVDGAGAVVVSTPTIAGDAPIAIGFPSVFQLAAQAGLSFTTIARFEVVTAFSVQTVTATNNVATVEITPPADMMENSTVTLTVTATDNAGHVSNPATHDVAVVKAAVIAPMLLAPVEGSKIGSSSVTFVTSSFVARGIGDAHTASQFRILNTNDEVIYDSGEVKTLLNHTATNLSLEREAMYKMQARHKGNLLGWSEWGAFVTVSVSVVLHGTRIDNKATVIGPFFYSGKNRFIAVLDAAYRNQSNMFSSDAKITGLPARGSATFPSTEGTITPSEPWETTLARANDPNSSKYNTDFLQTQKGLASQICRNITLEGSPCDMPNAPAAMAIWKNRAFLDSVDPTIAANSEKSLAKWNFLRNWGYVRTSSLSGNDMPANIANTLITSSGTFSYAVFEQYAGFIIPILEIDA